MTAPLLIVNADDFGLTVGVSHAILRAGELGVVTSTSALANGRALSECAPSLRDSALGVGAHLALVGEQGPVLSAREIPTLVDAQGRLASGWRPFLTRCALGRVDKDDVRREFAAQIERLRAHGLTLTHLDTHQNLHLWPSIAEVTIDAARSNGIGAIRVTRSDGLSPIALGVRAFSARLEARVRKAGVRFPAATAGFDEAGRLDETRICSAIEHFADRAVASAELVTHPSVGDDVELEALGWNYRGQEELDALTSTDVRRAVELSGFRLGTFADLEPAQPIRPRTSR
jgi:predicted glycoside hydrolase/deacetylase ChbG (UPF0249 family)